MIEVIKKETRFKNKYRIIVVGAKKFSGCKVEYNETETYVGDENFGDIDYLFYSAVGAYYPINNGSKRLGENFKNGPLKDFLGFFVAEGEVDIFWDDIYSVKIDHIDGNGVVEEVELIDLKKEYGDEFNFLKAIRKAYDDRCKEVEDYRREDYYIRWFNHWEFPKVKEILRANGWDDDDLENMFYINSDICFGKLESLDNESYIERDIAKFLLQAMKNNEGLRYTGFKSETLEMLKKAINASEELSSEQKEFAIQVLTNFKNKVNIQTWEIEKLRDILKDYRKRERSVVSCGKDGYSGINLGEITDVKEYMEYNYIDNLDDCVDGKVIDYEGKKYVISESD